jgi:hypothetical protein
LIFIFESFSRSSTSFKITQRTDRFAHGCDEVGVSPRTGLAIETGACTGANSPPKAPNAPITIANVAHVAAAETKLRANKREQKQFEFGKKINLFA